MSRLLPDTPSESFAFARVLVLRFARNARGLSPRAPGTVDEGRQQCGAAMLRVAASHQFASAKAGFAWLTPRPGGCWPADASSSAPGST
jgi:hypothetical protein